MDVKFSFYYSYTCDVCIIVKSDTEVLSIQWWSKNVEATEIDICEGVSALCLTYPDDVGKNLVGNVKHFYLGLSLDIVKPIAQVYSYRGGHCEFTFV